MMESILLHTLVNHRADCCDVFHYVDDDDDDDDGGDDDAYANQSLTVMKTDHGDAFCVSHHHHHHCASDVVSSINNNQQTIKLHLARCLHQLTVIRCKFLNIIGRNLKH